MTDRAGVSEGRPEPRGYAARLGDVIEMARHTVEYAAQHPTAAAWGATRGLAATLKALGSPPQETPGLREALLEAMGQIGYPVEVHDGRLEDPDEGGWAAIDLEVIASALNGVALALSGSPQEAGSRD